MSLHADHRFNVSLEEYQAQREKGWTDFHPENYCQRCGSHNPTWYVDSDRFNASMEALGLTSGVIVCPSCFVEGHEKATGLTCAWQLVPGTHFVPVPSDPPEEK